MRVLSWRVLPLTLTFSGRLVIADGLPEETDEEREKRSAGNKAQGTFCTLRGTIWKLLLGALHVDAQRYIELIELGPCWADHKLRNDTFRTFKVKSASTEPTIFGVEWN